MDKPGFLLPYNKSQKQEYDQLNSLGIERLSL